MSRTGKQIIAEYQKMSVIPKPVWAVGFALEQTLRDATLAVFSFLILKRLQHSTDYIGTFGKIY
jgi:hypothetical protein